MEVNKEQEVLKTIIQKAWEDEAFKKALIENPVQAIEEATGQRVQLPEGKKLIVKDQTDASTVYINIPVEQKLDEVELTEEQLELVAGGMSIWPPIITIPKIPFIPIITG